MKPESQRIAIDIQDSIGYAYPEMNIESPVLAERFWSKVGVNHRLRCWPWMGTKDKHGYGTMMNEGKFVRAPRVAFFLRNSKWPDNACHACDNPICCNPDHIFDGTHGDNMRDMIAKGRNKPIRGEKHGRAVLRDYEVLSMRQEYSLGRVSLTELARKFGCSFSTVRRVIARENWKHL